MVESVSLLGLDRQGLQDWFASIGEKPFRAEQLMRWLYHQNTFCFDDMLNLGKPLRARLNACADASLPKLVSMQIARDGTCKWILEVGTGQHIETVFIPERSRGTLCISSQVGCALNCSFCATGRQGFAGNLTAAQIVGQICLAALDLSSRPETAHHRITNVVFMGMGEPLLNFEAALTASNLAMDDLAFGLSRRRVTISTAGVVPAILRLAEHSKVSLAVSLHAPNDDLRDVLVPLNKKYPLAELMAACRTYNDTLGAGRQVTIEYTLLRGVNDSNALAHELAALLNDLDCKINLIPFNAFVGVDYRTPAPGRVTAFWQILSNAGLRTTIRKPRGTDIAAACGQLVGDFQDKTKRRIRHQSVI